MCTTCSMTLVFVTIGAAVLFVCRVCLEITEKEDNRGR